MSCGFQGNPDIYGIGIRIGYYTQALAVWFSCYFFQSELQGLRAVNNLFLIALCIATPIYFANTSTNFVIEAFLILQIGLVIGLVGITERSRYTSKYVKNSKERMIVRIVIIMTGSLFNVCFWWILVDAMAPTPCNDRKPGVGNRDSTFFFYFYKTSIYGWAGTLMKIQSMAAVLWTAPIMLFLDVAVLTYEFRLKNTRAAFVDAVNCKESHVTGKKMTEGSFQDGQFLKETGNAMDYLEKVFSTYQTKMKPKKRNLRHCFGFQGACSCTGSPASYTQCLKVWIKSNFNKSLFNLRWRVAIYMTATGQYSSMRWPSIVHHIFVLKEASQPPDWRHVAIASDVLLTQIPAVTNQRTWILGALWQLKLIIFLILQVELTIVWNHISGLQSFSSLGQLIPFILGVGGLLKVLWGKWTLVRKGIRETRLEYKGDYEIAMARFLEGREKKPVDQKVVRAATA